MDIAPWRTGPGTVPGDAHEPEPRLDYYLILAPGGGAWPAGEVDGIVVEEFLRGPDHSTVGLDNAGWTAADGRCGAPPRSAGGCAPTRSCSPG
ncbi:hypothetical protein [Micromonospora echinaurantiaca]|uniref:hypothetical protein n=1 Tax=Micromonospora echinaurantiaca TaxID=47857 RepID=UPI00344482EB